MATKVFPFGKIILLNTVYDVLELLDYPMKYSDSYAGLIRFDHRNGMCELSLKPREGGEPEETSIDITGADNELSGMFFDEMSSLLRTMN